MDSRTDSHQFVPILPFDVTYGINFRLYDNLPYQQDLNYSGKEHICMESGNVLKYYRCNLNKPALVGGR